jgi:glycine cleavage system aminomethyltransferase T
MPWIVKADKEDFVGKWALPHAQVRERLVGFTADILPPEGAQVVRDGRIAGRVTSARRSERLGTVIGLAWVDPDHAEDGARIRIRANGELHDAVVTLKPFYDPEGALLRS